MSRRGALEDLSRSTSRLNRSWIEMKYECIDTSVSLNGSTPVTAATWLSSSPTVAPDPRNACSGSGVSSLSLTVGNPEVPTLEDWRTYDDMRIINRNLKKEKEPLRLRFDRFNRH